MTIDAHHHFWRYNVEEYGWITPEMALLKRDFLVGELATEMRGCGIDGAVAVEARQTVEETRWLLDQAQESAALRGVVGWAAIAHEDLPAVLEELLEKEKLVGLRHVVQSEDAGFLDGADFNRGIRRLGDTGLVYDILISEGQMEEAIRFVDRHPKQRFVLDHMAKPKIAAGEMQPWERHLRELSRREHVSCKVSGMVTEAVWSRWTLETLRPYLDVAVEAFGVGRLMAGSDWPVCLVAAGYGQWWEVLREYFSTFTQLEQDSVFGETAVQVYGLE